MNLFAAGFWLILGICFGYLWSTLEFMQLLSHM